MTAHAIAIRDNRRPGDDALIVELHRRGYAGEGPRFAQPFLDFVAKTVAEGRLDESDAGKVWFAEAKGEGVGCAALIDRGSCGQLRWVVLAPEARGQGVGRRLVEEALIHARARGHSHVYLETTDGLAASMKIYEQLGFRTVYDEVEPLWDGEGRMIRMETEL